MNNLNYVGSVSTLSNGRKPMLNYGATTYSEEQNKLYNALLVGRNAFTKQEWYELNQKKKSKIVKRFKKAQVILNQMKQEALLNTSIVAIKSKNKIAQGLLDIINTVSEGIQPDPEFICTMSFKDLGITKDHRVERFLSEGLLPPNFNEL